MKADSGYTQAFICTNGRVTEPHALHSSQLAAAAQNLAPHQGQHQAQVTPQGLCFQHHKELKHLEVFHQKYSAFQLGNSSCQGASF